MIRFERVRKGYLGLPPVLEDASFEIPARSFCYLTGASGSGKTTIFKLITLQELPDGGQIHFAEKPLTRLRAQARAVHRRRVGVIFQDYRLLEEESVSRNVHLPLQLLGLPAHRLKKRGEALLTQVGLQHRRHQPTRALSGGEKQLLALARALALDPQVILADEPTGNLDYQTATQVMQILRRIHEEEHRTVVVATHDVKMMSDFQARILLIRAKRLHEVKLAAPTSAAGPSLTEPGASA